MEPKLPESSFLDPPHEVEGPPKEARESFYELAKDKIRYLTNEEILKWYEDMFGRRQYSIPAAAYIIGSKKEKNFEKWIHNLEIIVKKDAFNIEGKDYSDILPFVLEHEIYEAWLSGKRGTGPKLSVDKKHLLALRREYLLAEQQGLGDKLLEWDTLTGFKDKSRTESEYALRVAKKQLQGKK